MITIITRPRWPRVSTAKRAKCRPRTPWPNRLLVLYSVGDTVFVLHRLAEGGQSVAGRQGRDIGPAEETRRIQRTSAVRRRPVGRPAHRPRVPDTARPVGRVAAHVQPAGHGLHAVRRPQEERECLSVRRSIIGQSETVLWGPSAQRTFVRS